MGNWAVKHVWGKQITNWESLLERVKFLCLAVPECLKRYPERLVLTPPGLLRARFEPGASQPNYCRAVPELASSVPLHSLGHAVDSKQLAAGLLMNAS